jgi:aryl-alcohol dehydrogenase-like predicted oxidoreductase
VNYLKTSSLLGDFHTQWYENEPDNKVFLNDLQIVEKPDPLPKNHNISLEYLALEFTSQHTATAPVISGIKSVTQADRNNHTSLLPPLEEMRMAQIDILVSPGVGLKMLLA